MNENELSSTMEDYLEAIYILVVRHKVARVRDIADNLNVTMASASKALKTLGKQGYIFYEPYKYITLKEKGLLIARGTLAKHKSLENFFSTILLLDKEESNRVACEFEHVIDFEILKKIEKLRNFITRNKEREIEWFEFLRPTKK